MSYEKKNTFILRASGSQFTCAPHTIHHHHQKFIIEDNYLTIIQLLYIIFYIGIWSGTFMILLWFRFPPHLRALHKTTFHSPLLASPFTWKNKITAVNMFSSRAYITSIFQILQYFTLHLHIHTIHIYRFRHFLIFTFRHFTFSIFLALCFSFSITLPVHIDWITFSMYR